MSKSLSSSPLAGPPFKARKSSSFGISLLFAGPYKVNFESEIVPLRHALKTSFLSALPQQSSGLKHADTHSAGRPAPGVVYIFMPVPLFPQPHAGQNVTVMVHLEPPESHRATS
jgi:hypothetical protein